MEKEINIKCTKCLSKSLRLEKWAYGKKNRKTYLIKIICLDCSHREGQNINPDLYELTRLIGWRNKNRKPLERAGFDYLIINSFNSAPYE